MKERKEKKLRGRSCFITSGAFIDTLRNRCLQCEPAKVKLPALRTVSRRFQHLSSTVCCTRSDVTAVVHNKWAVYK